MNTSITPEQYNGTQKKAEVIKSNYNTRKAILLLHCH